MTQPLKPLRVQISGRVQGVGFRMWTRDLAAELGFSGWVRNLPNGDVEAQFIPVGGMSSGDLEYLQSRLWEGPAGARVSAIQELESGELEPDGGFVIMR